MAEYQVISADSHVNPPPDFWRSYLPVAFQDAAPRLERAEDADYIVFEGKRKPMLIMTGAGGKKVEEYRQVGRKEEARQGGWDATARLADLAMDGVDAEVLYGGGPLASRDFGLHIASFEAYNRWLADFCTAAPKQLFGIAYIPTFDVTQMIEQTKLAKKLGLRGVLLSAFPQSKAREGGQAADAALFAVGGDPFSGRTYADPEFDPFWAAAVDLDIPVHMHLGGRANRFASNYFWGDILMGKLTMAEPIATLICGGVFQRFPKLKYVTVESAVGWFAFVAQYLDKVWHKHKYWTKNDLKEPPSHYMDRHVWGTFMDDPIGVQLRHNVGARNIMWASDYPHAETTFPHSRAVIERNFAGVPAEDVAWMVSGAARKLYGIG